MVEERVALPKERVVGLFNHLGAKRDPELFYNDLNGFYRESHRRYHDTLHILRGLEDLDLIWDEAEDPEAVELGWLYHDARYNPLSKTNEQDSANILSAHADAMGLSRDPVDRAIELILTTTHKEEPQTVDAHVITDLDFGIFGRNREDFDLYEAKVREEYREVPELSYRVGRREILERIYDRQYIFYTETLSAKYEIKARKNLRRSLRKLKERWAVYAGTFDPPTKGHQYVLEKGAEKYDKVFFAIGVNPDKKPMFSTEERLEMMKACSAHLPNVIVDHYSGLTMDYAEKMGTQYSLRGLRNATDFAAEYELRQINEDLNPKVTSIFVMTRNSIDHISSSYIREMIKVDPKRAEDKLHPAVYQRITAKSE